MVKKTLGIYNQFRMEPNSYHSRGRSATLRAYPNHLIRTLCRKSHNGPVCLSRSLGLTSGMAAGSGAAAICGLRMSGVAIQQLPVKIEN